MDKDAVVRLACPATKLMFPSRFVPSKKLTVPPGVPEAGATALTLAEKVTGCPATDGFADEVRAVVLLALFTVCRRDVADVLATKLLSPL
jgi:hypothetical protein